MNLKTVTAGLLALGLAGSSSLLAQGAELKTDDDKAFYALGLFISRNVGVFNLTPAELEIVKSGLSDGVTGKTPKVELETWGPKLQMLAQARAKETADKEKKAGEAFAAKAAAEPGARKLAGGTIIKETKPGTGAKPTAADTVKVHYEGKLIDGTVFDSSVKRGEPAEFALNRVIKCWTEGVQEMKAGGKAKLVCPSDIAYGDAGSPPNIKPGSTLVFDVELLEVKPAEAAAKPAAAPAPAAAEKPAAKPAPAPKKN
jgi:FKBP-type peptidyl-prolyl cis-trans isomerase FkpA